MKNPVCLVACAFSLISMAVAAPEAFEAGPANARDLPGGKEADGIIGDFILRSDRIEAVISADKPHRKANMSTYWTATAPGCLFDLTRRGAHNDQLTIFAPCGQQGPVSHVRIVHSGSNGQAVVESVTTAANNKGLYKRHQYHARDGLDGLIITTTLRNEGSEKIAVPVQDRISTFTRSGSVGPIHWADAVDPADKAAYAYAWIEQDGALPPSDKEIELAPGQEVTVSRMLAIGRSPAEAFGIVSNQRGPSGRVHVSIKDENGRPLPGATLEIAIAGKELPAYMDAEGKASVALPPGRYEVRAFELGRKEAGGSVTVAEGRSAELNLTLGAASAVVFDIRGEDGRSLPCKAQFRGMNGTEAPDLGPPNRAHGCKDQYHSETGQFRVQLAPGDYRIIVTRGTEYSHLEKEVKLKPGATEQIKGVLRRIVDTTGWISTDYHNHSTPSGDNTCGTDDRIINLAAEQIEFAPTTEHNRFYDWAPHIAKLGLSNELATIPGIELTGPGAHFNAFPFKPHPHEQDGGAPQWQKDPRLNAIVLRDFQGHLADRWVQLNHPDMVEDFIDRDGDGRVDGGYWGLGELVDGAETWGLNILESSPFYIGKNRDGKDTVIYRREFIWLQLLNRGHRYVCVAVSDAHSVHGNGVGGWRSYVRSSTDDPAALDWKEISRNSKAGQVVVTTGPFLEVQTGDGTIAGGTTRALESIDLDIKVQCTDWIDIDRVQVLVNGRQVPELNFTRKSHPDWFSDGLVKFERRISVPLSQDSHLIVVAYGENSDLSTGYGSSTQAKWRPCAYNNPIYVDVDGGGFTPNNDLLGWALPVKLGVEEAKRILEANSR